MDNFDDVFIHYPEYRIVVCRRCRYAIVPAQANRHFRDQHSDIRGPERKAITDHLTSLADVASRPQDVIKPDAGRAPIPDLPTYHDGLRCEEETADGQPCSYICRATKCMQRHYREVHDWVNPRRRGGDSRPGRQPQEGSSPWTPGRTCQCFFRTGGWQQYFEVATCEPRGEADTEVADAADAFFQQQVDGVERAKADAAAAANVVAGFDLHRSSVVPWLRTTGIAEHVHGLDKDAIAQAISLTPEEGEDVLVRLWESLDRIIHQALGRCREGPEKMMTYQTTVVLNRFQPAEVEGTGRTRPFDTDKEPATINAYTRRAKQLFAYIYRVIAPEEPFFAAGQEINMAGPNHIVRLTEAQMHSWQRIIQSLTAAGPGPLTTGRLDSMVLELWVRLIRHTTGARPFESPLVSFCALNSIKQTTGSWMEAGNFNSTLSAMIWVVQLVIFFCGTVEERQGRASTLDYVKRTCDGFMHQTVETPMGEIVRWRLLLFRVSRDDIGEHSVTWDVAQEVLTYRSTRLRLEDVRNLLKMEYDGCCQLLHDALKFGSDLPPMHGGDLHDRPEEQQVGWSFVDHEGNAERLRGRDTRLLQVIAQSGQLRRVFHREGTWREAGVVSYEGSVQEFLRRLCTLIHISGGQPVREPEFFSMTWRNTQSARGITIRDDGRVMIYLTYHKGQKQTGRFKPNIRVLARPVGDLLLEYLVYVQPLRQIFRRRIDATPPTALLWERNGAVWPEGSLTQCLEQSSVRAGIDRLHIANWRQMSVAIVKTKFATDGAIFADDTDDEDGEEAETSIRAMTKQRNHTTRTVNRAYANAAGPAFANAWDALVRKGDLASTLWQDFWGVARLGRGKTRARESVGESSIAKRVDAGLPRQPPTYTPEELLAGLRRLHQDETAEWRSPEQRRAVATVVSGDEQIVIVLPTGAGKSLAFMLPCTLRDARTTVLVVPLVALRVDLSRRLLEGGVMYAEWSVEQPDVAPLVLVSVEAAATDDFLAWARHLHDTQQLDRIVIDECHLTVTAAAYRKQLADLAYLRRLRTQFVYLTATLPPTMQAALCELHLLTCPTVIRASSDRANIEYKVVKADSTLIAASVSLAIDCVPRHCTLGRTSAAGGEKIILYAGTKDLAGALASQLRCEAYTAGTGTPEEKRAVLNRWTTDPTCPFIVATSALAEGFDYPSVRVVIVVGLPRSLIELAQQAGRAGRDGHPAWLYAVVPPTPPTGTMHAPVSGRMPDPRADDSLARETDHAGVLVFFGTQCRRAVLTGYLDGNSAARTCHPESGPLCDICQSPPRAAAPELPALPQRPAGISLIRSRHQTELDTWSRYRRHLDASCGMCLYCRGAGKPDWDHKFDECPSRHKVISASRAAMARKHPGRAGWIAPYTACFRCFQPQSICSGPRGRPQCEYRDMLFPLCYGILNHPGGVPWLIGHFERRFEREDQYVDWFGDAAQVAGQRVTQAARVAMRRLDEFFSGAVSSDRLGTG